ncbi:MAG: sulfotransferase [Pseudomonadota bacterium]
MKLIFLTGHRKSGTTLLHKLFDGHPGICVYPVDLGILYAYFPAFTSDPDIDDSALLQRLDEVIRHGFRRQEADIDDNRFSEMLEAQLKGKDIRSKSTVLTALLGSWQEFTGADPGFPVLIKETSQAIYFDEFLSAFPEMRMVNLLRDPRDNFSAIKAGVTKHYSKLGEGDLESLASLINRARMDFRAGMSNAAETPSAFCNLRFEDLAADPEKTMQNLVEFLDISFDETLLKPTIQGKNFAGNSYDGLKFGGVSTQNVGRWRERISEKEAMIIEYWMESEMKSAGYETVFPVKDCKKAFGEFYAWYNSNYFFRDAFSKTS